MAPMDVLQDKDYFSRLKCRAPKQQKPKRKKDGFGFEPEVGFAF